MNQFSIQEIAEQVSGKLVGKKDTVITGLGEIEQAIFGQLTFIGNRKYAKLWKHSQASAALVNQNLDLAPGKRSLVQVESADLAMAQVLKLFAPPRPQSQQVFTQQLSLTPRRFSVGMFRLGQDATWDLM